VSDRPPPTPLDAVVARARPQLDRAAIVDAAVELSARNEPKPLTVRRLGHELGADPTAIYRHFRDKEELVRAMIDRLIEIAVSRVDAGADWRARLSQMADALLDSFTSHPSIGAEAASKTTGGPGELSALNLIIRAMSDAGLDHEDAVRYYGVFSTYVLVFASALADERFATSDPETPENPRWLAGLASLDVDRYPALAAVRPDLDTLHDRDIFGTGVAVILDAVESRAYDVSP
jgi:AcrR family transcriptional regulator